MFIYLIYFIVFVILLIVIILGAKAVNRGIEAKNKIKENFEKNQNDNFEEFDVLENNKELNLSNEIKKLNKLHSDGILSDEEFKKAKEKILK